MNNLYNKIYEAIDSGIQKALIIDNDQSQDISIGWHEKNMTTNNDMLNHYVRQLLSNSISDENIKHYYSQITQFKAKNKKATYKINNIHKLIQIFDNLYHIKLTKKCNLSWLDTFNVMSFIMSDNSELSLCDINNVNRTDVKYIKFQGFDNCEHPIIIHKNLLIKNFKEDNNKWLKKKLWPTPSKSYNDFDCINNQKLGLTGGLYTMQSNHDKMIKAASYDFNGYEHTYNNADITSNNRKLSNYPAIDYAIQQSNGIMQGYLPATGELIEIIKISNVLNLILDLVLHVSKMNVSANYWSSTEYNNMLAWYITMGTLSVTDKTDGAHIMVLPIFKKC